MIKNSLPARPLPILTSAVLVATLTARVVAQGATSPSTSGGDWSRIVPGDARFYVELRNLGEIRTFWQGIGIWHTVREMAQDKAQPTSRPWPSRAEELLGLGSEDAITHLLGHRSALIAAESSQWNGGVVLAELESTPDLEALLKRWEARQQADEGPVKRYTLAGGILLAVSDRTLVLGPADDPDGLWGRTVLLLGGRRGPSLAARSDYGALRSRLSGDPQGLLFSAWQPDDPYAFAGCTRLVATAQVAASEINCDLMGQLPAPRPDESPLSAADLAALPASTLAVWAGPVDFAGIIRKNAEGRFGSPETLAGIFLDVLTASRFGDTSFIEQLGPTVRLVAAIDPGAAGGAVDLPALTLLIESKKRTEIIEHLDGLLGIFVAMLQYAPSPSSEPAPGASVELQRCEDVELHSIRIGPFLAHRFRLEFLDNIELAWAYVDDALLLSTSRRHSEQIVRALRRKADRLDRFPDAIAIFPPSGRREEMTECFYLRGRALSEMLSNWLASLEGSESPARQPEWWRTWLDERLGQRDKLGLALGADPADPRRAVVLEIDEGSPAAGYLEIGDRIIGVGGSPVATAQEIARRYRRRGGATEFSLDVVRGEKTIRVQIPVAPSPMTGLDDFDPVRALRQIATLSRHAESVSVWRFASRRDRLDAQVRVRWQPPGPSR
ncbi:MAG TPA: PDZ domain-containing protein [Phycisphaerae bacterium]|nr:PDZ domain-containing protein [Phycisphaerae bacterium]